MPTVFNPDGLLGKTESTVFGKDESKLKKITALGVLGALGIIGAKVTGRLIDRIKD